jgi:bla regulator protein blaR1
VVDWRSLMDERERACDEKVVAQGSEPQVYAKGILKVCEFYRESPLACAAGVTGSNLKKRIEEIMSQAQSQPLPSSLLPPPVAASFDNTVFTKDAVFTPTQFNDGKTDEISGRPHGYSSALFLLNECLYIRNVQLKGLIAYAYGLPDFQISGTPEWANTQGYDLSLKLADPPNRTPVREAVQKLLEEQFKLVVHREIKDAAVYDLVVADGGLKLTGEHSKGVNWTPKAIFTPPGPLTATDLDMAGLLFHLNRITQRVVVDKTGLKGAYAFTLDWTSDANHPDSDALIAALKDQLGLELRPRSAPTAMLVVDHAKRVGSN